MGAICEHCREALIREELEDSDYLSLCDRLFGGRLCFVCFSEPVEEGQAGSLLAGKPRTSRGGKS